MDNVEKIDLAKVDWKSSREFFESLSDALDALDNKDESYNFTWAGKRKSIIEAGAPINRILRPDIDASRDFDKTENMLIVGDNLDALKLLQESYLGKIKMIYIDPPYNTGRDFVYHDNFAVKKGDYEDSSVNAEGKTVISEDEYIENSKSNGRFHSDWLSMMYPRLKLARNLLSDDGVIFISIDDNEQANLRKLCEEIFGEGNFIANLIWKSKSGGANDSGFVATDHEYVMLIAKNQNNQNSVQMDPYAEATTSYNNEDEKGRYALERLDKQNLSYSKSLDYDLVAPDGTVYKLQHKNPDAPNAIWRWSKQKVQDNIDDLVFKDGHVYTKNYEKKGGKLRTLLVDEKYGRTRTGSTEVYSLLGGNYFDNPKTVKLIKNLVAVGTMEDSIVLDFFAGSGTTGQAVMEMNAEDGGHRKFICVQLDEETGDKTESKKAGYNTIDQITAERLRRAGDDILGRHSEASIDVGFRVFRIDGENENDAIRKPLGDINQAELFSSVENIKNDRTPLDLLFGVVCVSALPFDLSFEARKIGDNTVYLYGYLGEGSGLVACFDEQVSEQTIKAIAKMKALIAAFKDGSFGSSADKINLSEQFRVVSPDTKVKVI